MRILLLAGMMAMAAFAAHAGSIEVISKDNDSAKSIEKVSCPICAPLKKKKAEITEISLTPGTEKVEVKQVDGVLKVYRTEAWLGGSPVVYVSKASTDLVDAKTAQVEQKPTGPAITELSKDAAVTIDTSTTSAVTADMSPPDLGAKAKPDVAKHSDVAVKVEKDTAPTISKDVTSPAISDKSGGAKPAEKPEVAQHFNPQSLELRLKVD